jgi:hypothetical protein
VERYLQQQGHGSGSKDAAPASTSSNGASAEAEASAAPASSGPKPTNPYTGAPVEAPEDNIASVTYGYLVSLLGPGFDDIVQERRGLGWGALDVSVGRRRR